MAGLFDIFSSGNAQDAANAQIAGINRGYGQATQALDQGNQALTTNFNAALKPLQQNYGQAQGGVKQLLAALGVGGPGGAAGGQQITDLLRSTPGYQFRLGQGNENLLRNAGRSGTLASGGTLDALQTQGQGQADQTYQQFIQNLQPFLGASGNAASGIANVNMGLGQGLNQNANTLAQLGYRSSTDVGNANANADLAKNAASGNIWRALLGGGQLIAGGIGGGGLDAGNGGGPLSKIGMLNPGQFGGFAEGGKPPVGQPSVVGEKGPELFVPDKSGTIVPNDIVKRLMQFLPGQSLGGPAHTEGATYHPGPQSMFAQFLKAA